MGMQITEGKPGGKNEILEELAKRIETEAKTPEEAAAIIRDYKEMKAE